jgi:hypothetical protein
MTALHPPDTPYREDAAGTDASASLGRYVGGPPDRHVSSAK